MRTQDLQQPSWKNKNSESRVFACMVTMLFPCNGENGRYSHFGESSQCASPPAPPSRSCSSWCRRRAHILRILFDVPRLLGTCDVVFVRTRRFADLHSSLFFIHPAPNHMIWSHFWVYVRILPGLLLPPFAPKDTWSRKNPNLGITASIYS